jgi:type II secretory pathway predicted ATPase ExeA
MTGMTDQETSSYVSHHLTLAGQSDTLFSDDVLALIHQVSRGLLNCDLCIETPPAKRVACDLIQVQCFQAQHVGRIQQHNSTFHSGFDVYRQGAWL